MKHLKRIALAATATVVASLFAVSAAPATTLEIAGVTKNESIALTLTLKAGDSLITRDTSGFSQNTCTTSETAAATNSPHTGATVTAAVTTLSYANCSDPVTVHKKGTLHIAHITGTTNGTVSSSGTSYTMDGPFGYLNCVTGAGTHLGQLTGGASGNATLDVSAVLDCGISLRATTKYTVTNPSGLGVSA
jgi:hypothetical protein